MIERENQVRIDWDLFTKKVKEEGLKLSEISKTVLGYSPSYLTNAKSQDSCLRKQDLDKIKMLLRVKSSDDCLVRVEPVVQEEPKKPSISEAQASLKAPDQGPVAVGSGETTKTLEAIRAEVASLKFLLGAMTKDEDEIFSQVGSCRTAAGKAITILLNLTAETNFCLKSEYISALTKAELGDSEKRIESAMKAAGFSYKTEGFGPNAKTYIVADRFLKKEA